MRITDFDEGEFSSDTKIYRYLSAQNFDRLLNFGIGLTRISTWPDRFEASDFSFYANAQRFGDHRKKANFFASCWTREIVDCFHFDNSNSFECAQEELLKEGSGSMWEAYCPCGGVRISTTLGKLDRLFCKHFEAQYQVYRGKVRYLAARDRSGVLGKRNLEQTLFYKRVGYHHEREYRYVIHDDTCSDNYLVAPITECLEFLDEVLVFPLKDKKLNDVANVLHSKGCKIATGPDIGTNNKDDRAFCRVSQLYGLVSETIGHVHYIAPR